MNSSTNNISERNALYNKIKEYDSFIKMNENAIRNLTSSNADEAYVLATIQKLKNENSKYEEKKLELTLEISEVGVKKSEPVEKKVKFTLGEVPKEPKKKNTVLHQSPEKYVPAVVNPSAKEMQKSYEYFTRVSDELPPAMHEKLGRMPSNSGYTWRGVNFFGRGKYMPNEKMILYERQNGVIQRRKFE